MHVSFDQEAESMTDATAGRLVHYWIALLYICICKFVCFSMHINHQHYNKICMLLPEMPGPIQQFEIDLKDQMRKISAFFILFIRQNSRNVPSCCGSHFLKLVWTNKRVHVGMSDTWLQLVSRPTAKWFVTLFFCSKSSSEVYSPMKILKWRDTVYTVHKKLNKLKEQLFSEIIYCTVVCQQRTLTHETEKNG